MSAKWIDAEDKLLRQLTSIGLNAKQIHSTYSTLLQGRSVKAIEQRLCYLNKPAEQRRQDDMASMDDTDRLIEAIDNARDRICNRLDSIALSLAHLNRTMEDLHRLLLYLRRPCRSSRTLKESVLRHWTQ